MRGRTRGQERVVCRLSLPVLHRCLRVARFCRYQPTGRFRRCSSRVTKPSQKPTEARTQLLADHSRPDATLHFSKLRTLRSACQECEFEFRSPNLREARATDRHFEDRRTDSTLRRCRRRPSIRNCLRSRATCLERRAKDRRWTAEDSSRQRV